MDQDSLKLLKGRTSTASLELRVRDAGKDVVQDELEVLIHLERESFLRKQGTTPKVPRDRTGQFRAAVFPPYARRTPDLSDLVVSMYAAGVSDRKISDLLALLLGHRYSHQVTRYREAPSA